MQTAVMEAKVLKNEEGIKELRDDAKEIRKIVIGNGEIGMAEELRNVSDTTERTYTMLESHVNEDKEEEDRKQKKRDKIQTGIIIGLVVEALLLLGTTLI